MKQDFINYVKNHLKEYLPSDFQEAVFETAEILNPNGQHLRGILIRNDLNNAVPSIFLNQYEQMYEDGIDIDEIMQEIANQVEEQFRLRTPDFGELSNDLFEYEIMKPKLTVKLCDLVKSKEFLEDKPYMPFGNLAITYHVQLLNDGDKVGSTVVDNELLDFWKISKEQLHKDALKADADRSEILLYGSNLGMDKGENLYNSTETLRGPFYILTSGEQVNGASAIVRRGVLKRLAELFDGDYYILPSSIYEMTLIPVANTNANLKDVDSMLQSFNDQSGLDEIVSDHALLYDRATGKLKYRKY